MIVSIRHKGLRRYWETGSAKGLRADWVPRLRRQLLALDAATRPEDMDLPGYRFHALKGREAGRYSIRVTGNRRLTFTFDGVDAVLIDLEDYH